MQNVAIVFSFLCNNSDRTWFFNALTFARSLGRCWIPRPSASVFNTSLGTRRILMHEKPCLIPILYVWRYPGMATIKEQILLRHRIRLDSHEMTSAEQVMRSAKQETYDYFTNYFVSSENLSHMISLRTRLIWPQFTGKLSFLLTRLFLISSNR